MGFVSDPDGQALLTAIQLFGLPGVRHAGDLTDLQLRFIHEAWVERQRQLSPTTDG